jgi:hypothetical protein
MSEGLTVNNPDFTPSIGTRQRQCSDLLAALRLGPVSTIFARQRLFIMSPAARVFDLKHRHGFSISTIKETVYGTDGAPIVCGVYYLQGVQP